MAIKRYDEKTNSFYDDDEEEEIVCEYTPEMERQDALNAIYRIKLEVKSAHEELARSLFRFLKKYGADAYVNEEGQTGAICFFKELTSCLDIDFK